MKWFKMSFRLLQQLMQVYASLESLGISAILLTKKDSGDQLLMMAFSSNQISAILGGINSRFLECRRL